MSVSELPERSYMQVFIDILISIVLQEAGIWHIINAEGEKMQAINYGIEIGKYNEYEAKLMQNSVNKVIQTTIQMEMLLLDKLKAVIDVRMKLEQVMHNQKN